MPPIFMIIYHPFWLMMMTANKFTLIVHDYGSLSDTMANQWQVVPFWLLRPAALFVSTHTHIKHRIGDSRAHPLPLDLASCTHAHKMKIFLRQTNENSRLSKTFFPWIIYTNAVFGCAQNDGRTYRQCDDRNGGVQFASTRSHRSG